MGPKSPPISLKTLALQMERVAKLEAQVNQRPPDEDLLSQARLVGLGLFRMVVAGEIKKGKSSFINALLGTRNLVPVHSDVATSTIFKIHYGPELKYTVYFQEGSGKAKQVIGPGELDEYGTENGNPDNKRQVDYIRVESPADMLASGLILVDTPGVGGLFKKHREITFKEVPKADAVFFLTDSVESPIGADEVRFLRELRQVTGYITFVQTKSSLADADARKQRMENNLSIIRDQVGLKDHEISYFVVDSSLKSDADESHDEDDLMDSGFPTLMTYLNNAVRKNREHHVAKAAMTKVAGRMLAIASTLDGQKQMLDADTEEKRRAIEGELSKLQDRLAEWEKEKKPLILDELRKGLSRLSRQAQEELAPLRPGGAIQMEFESQVERAETVEAVREIMGQIDSDLAAHTSKACLTIVDRVKERSAELLERLQIDLIESMDEAMRLQLYDAGSSELDINKSALKRVIDRESSDSFFEEARTAVYGGFAGVAIASVAGGIIGSVIPVVGTVVGSWAGMVIAGCWGGNKAVQINTTRKLEGLKRESYAALQGAIASAYQSASSHLTHLINEIQLETTSFIQRAVSRTGDDLARQRNDVHERQKSTQQEIAERRKRHALCMQELDGLQKSLELLRKSLN